MSPSRRQLLQALGLGALASATLPGRRARAEPETSPTRIVFFVQAHGHVTRNWTLPVPGGPVDAFAERSLVGLAPSDFSEVLRPLHPFRDRLLAIEGLTNTSVLADIAEVMRHGGDLNNHQIAVAGLLTGTRALQQPGVPCTGGARSLDQELARRTAAPGRFGSRVYGSDYVPNQTVSPFSFLGPGQASPVVHDPATAFRDLLGLHVPPPTDAPKTREELLRAMRPSVLDSVAREYELLAPRLGRDARMRLEDHRSLVRELEISLAVHASPGRAVPSCAPRFDGTGHVIAQFMRLIKLAFACDLTRVVTYVAPVPQCPELGYPAAADIHGYAHQSIEGNTSCGQRYDPVAERALTDLGSFYAGHLALLLRELDSVAEGTGSLLDHTVVVWVTELATPTHQHHDVCTVLAGGGSGFLRTGRYVRYPRTLVSPLANMPRIGPAQSRLWVSLLQAMGQTDTTFGMTEATASDGTTLSLRGALSELRRGG